MSSGAIINQISESTKKRIEFQTNHLRKMANGDIEASKSKESYQLMFEGAKYVLNIIEDDALCAQGTRNWLQQFDYEQLVFARDTAQALIDKKDEEGKIKIWTTGSDYPVGNFDSYFLTYEEAAETLLEIIKESSVKRTNKSNSFDIRPVHIRESELSDYIPNATLEDLKLDNEYSVTLTFIAKDINQDDSDTRTGADLIEIIETVLDRTATYENSPTMGTVDVKIDLVDVTYDKEDKVYHITLTGFKYAIEAVLAKAEEDKEFNLDENWREYLA